MLVIGFGKLSYDVLNIILNHIDIDITIASRNIGNLKRDFNHLKLTLSHIGKFPAIKLVECDVSHTEQLTELIHNGRFDYIFNTASIRTWWKNYYCNQKSADKLAQVPPGMWYPLHAPLVKKLMIAVKSSGTKAKVINACYPDVVHPALDRVNLSPWLGIGNISNVVPALRFSIGNHFNIPTSDINLRVAGHHAAGYKISRTGSTDGAPIFISAKYNNESLAIDCVQKKIIFDAYEVFKRRTGLEGQTMTAYSASSVFLTLFGVIDNTIHVTGFCGMEGGVPLKADFSDIDANSEDEIRLMKDCNIRGQHYDGISEIDDAGVVKFTNDGILRLKNATGFELNSCSLDELDDVSVHLNNILECL